MKEEGVDETMIKKLVVERRNKKMIKEAGG